MFIDHEMTQYLFQLSAGCQLLPGYKYQYWKQSIKQSKSQPESMSTFANTNKTSSSRRTSNNYYENQRDDLMDTDDLPSSAQSNVVSMASEIATDTDITSSEDDSEYDSSSTDYSLSWMMPRTACH